MAGFQPPGDTKWKKLNVFLAALLLASAVQSVPLEFDIAKYPFSCRDSYLEVFRLSGK
jgi:hypothetical protein